MFSFVKCRRTYIIKNILKSHHPIPWLCVWVERLHLGGEGGSQSWEGCTHVEYQLERSTQ